MKCKFKPEHPEKYVGDVKNIICRSSWEFVFCRRLDSDPAVIQWNSEGLEIKYLSPLDGKVHRYYPDFTIKRKSAKTGLTELEVVDINPHKECSPPVLKGSGKPTRKYLTEVATWGRNEAKWKYAKAYCEQHNMKFIVMDEFSLGLKKPINKLNRTRQERSK